LGHPAKLHRRGALKHRITDYQAFLGGVALIITGLVLFLKTVIYINIENYGSETIRARWLWELALSLQILSFAFMWAAHHGRVTAATGRWRRRTIIHAALGLGAVSMPMFLIIMAAFLDWFLYPPSADTIKSIIHVAVIFWAFSNVLIPLILGIIYRNGVWMLIADRGLFLAVAFLFKQYWPGILMVAGIVFSVTQNNNVGYILAPLLGYFQGSHAYFSKAFRVQVSKKIPL
jgi:hypothetical protein